MSQDVRWRVADAVQPGDIFLLQRVRWQGRHRLAEDITTPERALEAQVALATYPLTESDLEATFGPGWRTVVVIVRQAAVLTRQQADALNTAHLQPHPAFDNAAKNAVWDALEAAGVPVAGPLAARAAATRATIGLPPTNAWNAAWKAASAAAARHLIHRCGYNVGHHNTLMRAWTAVLGDPFKVAVTV